MSTLLAIGLANALAAAVLALPAVLIGRSRRRPALAHALWLLVLLKLVTPPLFNVNLPWLPAEPEAPQAEAKPAPAPEPERPIVLADLLVPPPASETTASIRLDDQALSRTQPAAPRKGELVAPSPAVEIPVADVVVPPPETDKSDPLTLLLVAWLAGTLFVVGRAAVNVWRFQRLLAHSRLAPADVQAQALEVARGMGMRSCPRVWLVPGALPPMVWAVGRARILFPAGLLDRLDGEARASLLAHELAHVRRRDHWVRWLELVVMGLYWWYPLAWIARRQMQAREEECCDAWAARHSEPRVYATAILDAVDFLAEAKPRLPAAASPLHTARSLRERLTLIMSGDSPRHLGWIARLTLLVLALSTLPLLPSLSRRVESAAPVVVEETLKAEAASDEPTDYNHVVNLVQGSDDAFSVTYSPDGKRIAAGMGNARRPGLLQVWDALTHKSLFETEHPRGVSSVAFSLDSKRLTWATWGGLVRTDRMATYEKEFALQLTGNHRVAYSGDGKYLALAGEDRSLRLLDSLTGELKRTLRPEPTALYCVTFSPSNKWIAVGGGAFQEGGPGGPNVVSILDVETGKLVTKLTGHDRVVLNVAFAPKEDLIATASFDHTVRVYDGKSFKLRTTLKGHTDAVKGLAFSPDGKTLATGSWDRTVRLWDPFAGKELATLEGHVGAVREIAFSPDGKYLVTGGARRSVKLWDVKARKEVVTLRQDDELPAPPPAIVLAVSPDGKTLATGNEDGTVTLLDAVTGRVTRTLKGHEDAVTALAFSRDGKRLASSGPDSVIKVWLMAQGKVEWEMKGHGTWVYSLAFSNDGKKLASGGYDRTVRLWNVETGKEIGALNGHKASVRGLAFSPDDRTLASASSDQLVRVWDVKERKLLGSLKGHAAAVRSVLFGRSGKELFSAGEDGLVKRWDVAEQKELASVKASDGEINCLSLSPGGGILAAGGQDGFVRFFSSRTLTQRAVRYAHQEGVTGLGFGADSERLFSLGAGRVILSWEPVPGPVRLFEGHTGPVRVATFSPDGKYLLSCGGWPRGDKTLRLWDVKTGEQVKLLTTAKTNLGSAAFTPDGTYAVAGRDDGQITMWDVNSGKEVRQFTGHKDGVPHLVFSPDGKWLLSSGHDKSMRLWDAKTGKETMKFAGHDDWVRCGAFVDGKRVLSGGRDRKVRLWDVETGKLVKTIDTGKDWVERLAVLPGGKRFLSVGGNAMKLWDLESGKLLRTYGEHGFGVTCVSLTKDGRTALTASYDGTTRLWDVETGAELRRYGHHRDWVWSVEVSPDGKTFATAGGGAQRGDEWLAGDDFAVRLWKMPQREKE